MARPQRTSNEPTTSRTFFITSGAYGKQHLFQSERMALLLVAVLYHYREAEKYLLHEFVVMPDHLHALLTVPPEISIERAVQFIKGGFSFRAKKELGFTADVWQVGFTDHRIRDASDYAQHRIYIHQNPVKRGLVSGAVRSFVREPSVCSGSFSLPSG
jgi:putative transposase